MYNDYEAEEAVSSHLARRRSITYLIVSISTVVQLKGHATRHQCPSSGSSAIPEVHVTIQNITPEVNSGSLTSIPTSAPLAGGFSSASDATFTSPKLPGPSSPTFTPLSQKRIAKTTNVSSSSLHSASSFMNVFPPVGEVVSLIKAEKPEGDFEELEQNLLEAGIFTSEQILLLPEDVLCVIGCMGKPQARIL